jgi:hypothetical protein
MKRLVLVLAAAVTVLAPFVVRAQQSASVPEIQFRSVADFLKPPADINFGEVAGVAVNSKGHVFVFSR